jgi:hypothetical protein
LIPAQLQRGIFPEDALLKKYHALGIYAELIASIKQGSLQRFDRVFLTHQAILIKWGTWLVFERIRILVVRQLFKKIWCMLDKPSRLTISVLERGISVSTGKDHTFLQDVFCLVVNLIDRGYLKGYISNEKQTVVLSNKDPFPTIN